VRAPGDVTRAGWELRFGALAKMSPESHARRVARGGGSYFGRLRPSATRFGLSDKKTNHELRSM